VDFGFHTAIGEFCGALMDLEVLHDEHDDDDDVRAAHRLSTGDGPTL
jgi:hypothetical protein